MRCNQPKNKIDNNGVSCNFFLSNRTFLALTIAFSAFYSSSSPGFHISFSKFSHFCCCSYHISLCCKFLYFCLLKFSFSKCCSFHISVCKVSIFSFCKIFIFFLLQKTSTRRERRRRRLASANLRKSKRC